MSRPGVATTRAGELVAETSASASVAKPTLPHAVQHATLIA